MRWHNIAVHASMEALGALCALVMGFVLWRRAQREADEFLLAHAGGLWPPQSPSGGRPGAPQAAALATGFLGMGTLELFHAVSMPGNGFILLRHLASAIGAIGFALVWLPPQWTPVLTHRRWPWAVVGGSLFVGTAVLLWPSALPEMMRHGRFAPSAVAPIALASVLFGATSAWFLLDYRRGRETERLLFAGLALLFAIAEMMVTYSIPWDPRWWLWHGVRLLAYLLVLGYLLNGYQRMVSDLRRALMQTRDAEDSVRRSAEQLRRAMEERELIAQNLHDGIIQTLFAMSLNLERCQQLLATDPAEVSRQLGVGVASLKAAIRDLRAFVAGLDPQISDARELEAALALQVRLLNASGDLHIDLRVDPSVADGLTPAHATHLLHVAREAVSNSLRHARGTRATVTLVRRDGRIRLEVTDDGVGFVVDQAAAGEGLKNMAARAAKLHGSLAITSRPGDGTQVIFELPVEGVYA